MGINCNEILALYKIALYENKGIELKRPDKNIKNEVDLIFSGSENYEIRYEQNPNWQREMNYSANYKPVFNDRFSFLWYGTANNENLFNLRNNRNGFIVEIITKDGKSFVFPAPVFASEINQLNSNINTWEVVLSYRQPTFLDRLTKLNTLIMNYSFILGGNNTVLSWGDNGYLISK